MLIKRSTIAIQLIEHPPSRVVLDPVDGIHQRPRLALPDQLDGLRHQPIERVLTTRT